MNDKLKNTLLTAIHEGAKILRHYFEGSFEIKSKDTLNNLVTEVDKKAEEAIINIIQGEFPSHFILSEEVGELSTESNYKWIIDPIDGTVNFAHGIPICCISIGLELEGKMIMGAVFNPFMNELFFAEKGKGAFLNNKPIHVSNSHQIESACLVTGFPYKWATIDTDPIKVFEKFIRMGLPVRRLGSAAIDLCWVAAGRFDGFWEYNLNPWDIAAGYLIIEEAGGKITNFKGESYSVYDKETLATNGKIHDEILKVIS
ncbi:MAG: inositol monophosphatase [Chitinophagaceae bacterium]|nr:MAG: inositol monophosphatase [Bacteroidetes bacterium OLB11]MCC6448719.1 inositol monophosphatase [Chitinophagaceae bacterium]HMN32036.1 inositol monophosphatase family protein [Chitinophagaceae bacterium]